MAIIQYEGYNFEIDNEGFLTNFSSWNQTWAKYASQEQNLVLNADHWLVINSLQDYFKVNKVPPMVRVIGKLTGFKSKYIHELFTAGPGHGACKIAGLSKPAGCL